MARSRKYSITEARSNLPTVVREAEAGFKVELSRHGKPVAVLISIQEFERLYGERPSYLEACRRFRKEHAPDGLGFTREEIDALRDRDPGREVRL